MNRLVLMVVIGFASLLPALSTAAVISYNFGEAFADGSSNVNPSFLARAQAFRTTATDYVVTQVRADLSTITPSEQFAFEIYDTSAGLPNNPIETVYLGAGSVITNGALTTFSSLNLELDPSTQYWMVLTQVGNFQGAWGFNNETTGTGGGFLLDNTYRTGSSWAAVSQAQPYRMEVTAVPEPATLPLLASGLVIAALQRVLRRRG